jgi:hypothetical protein
VAGGHPKVQRLLAAALVAGVAGVADVAYGVGAHSVKATLVAATTVAATASAGSSELATAVEADQAAVVGSSYQASVDQAQGLLAVANQALSDDRLAAGRYADVASAASAALAGALERQASDRTAMAGAWSALQSAQGRLEAARQRLSALVIGLYAGGVDPLLPPEVNPATQYAQDALFGQAEAAEASLAIVGSVSSDAAADQVTFTRLRATLATDSSDVQSDRATAASASAAAARVEASLGAAQATVSARRADLAGVLSRRRSAVQEVLGASGNGISIMGPSALSASQLEGWFASSGDFDLSSATVSQLTSWYEAYGAEEGVRGDIAFAQAVLETGGFASPDAVGLNNYAGIGHCDSCSAGWQFPSPPAGVLGQLELLRTYAGSGAGPAAPVIAALDPANQSVAGCCQTWESLTGVWATDPNYGTKILSLYLSMLQYALAGGG